MIVDPLHVLDRIFVFRCPICGKRFDNDSAIEPLCSGPSESRDDHPWVTMELDEVRR